MCPYIPDQHVNTPQFNKLLTQFENEFGFLVGCVKFGQLLIPGTPRCVLSPIDVDCDSSES
ncbi:Glycogen_synthase [Hexamita inflata]|uniref:Glycogen synthase n=1 Tax=Hexamita inflata TaxID=28002 RepID=A0AA86RHZ8_9EUKA|nr:Glycogen synthase [Hexamita inflata]